MDHRRATLGQNKLLSYSSRFLLSGRKATHKITTGESNDETKDAQRKAITGGREDNTPAKPDGGN